MNELFAWWRRLKARRAQARLNTDHVNARCIVPDYPVRVTGHPTGRVSAWLVDGDPEARAGLGEPVRVRWDGDYAALRAAIEGGARRAVDDEPDATNTVMIGGQSFHVGDIVQVTDLDGREYVGTVQADGNVRGRAILAEDWDRPLPELDQIARRVAYPVAWCDFCGWPIFVGEDYQRTGSRTRCASCAGLEDED